MNRIDNNINEENTDIYSLKLPEELKRLSYAQCAKLCRQIRGILVRTVAANGGHLSSNLGTVELTVAMHRVFSCPDDKFVWDVGHQSYTHKLLTGRLSRFRTIRTEGGLSGFSKPSESEYDAFISGHSSNSISAALGIAKAMRMKNNRHYVVAVIGDGAFSGGMAYEGINNISTDDDNLIIILNHNNMSISKNVGAFAKYLSSIRANKVYKDTKRGVEQLLDNTPLVGEPIKRAIKFNKSALKYYLYRNTFFEDLGLAYLGPVDGHNIKEIEETLRVAKRMGKPVVIHVDTTKGKGFAPAEKNPGAFHGVSCFDVDASNPEIISENSFSAVFGKHLALLADKDSAICGITAAMKYGTGMQYFASSHRERFFDVGIAEQHAVTFAAGLSSQGMIPVFAVYSTFLQRAYDQLLHDNAIEGRHIVLGIDRAGLVGEDGETHQGIFDVAFLSTIPSVSLYSPGSYAELELCLDACIYNESGIAAIRYPRGCEDTHIANSETISFTHVDNGSNTLAVTYGRIANNLFKAAEEESFDILKLVRLLPLADETVEIVRKYDRIVFFEEGTSNGGIASLFARRLLDTGYKGSFETVAIDGFPKHMSVDAALKKYGFDASSMLEKIRKG